MTREALQTKYPKYKVVSEPSPGCTVCKGEGEVRTKSTLVPMRPCLCACVSGDDNFRAEVTGGFDASIAKTKKEMGF